MTIEIKAALDELQNTHKAFIEQVEAEKKKSDAITKEQIDKLNAKLDEAEAKYNTALKASARGGLNISEEKKEKADIAIKNLGKYLELGNNGISDEELKSFSIGGNPDGGYLLQPELLAVMRARIQETSPIRQIANVISTTVNEVDIPIIVNRIDGGWTTEQGARPETNTNAPLGKVKISVEELYAKPSVTQRFLDTVANGGSMVTDLIAETLALYENTAFVSGSGVGQPQGFLTPLQANKALSAAEVYSSTNIEVCTTGVNGNVTGDNLIAIFHRLKEAYQGNATWLMNRNVLALVRQLKGSTNDHYLWQPGLSAGNPSTIMGAPVLTAADMPVAATNSLSIAVGDFKKAYTIVDGKNMTILRDPYSNKPFVDFYTTKDVGGGVVAAEAIKVLRFAA